MVGKHKIAKTGKKKIANKRAKKAGSERGLLAAPEPGQSLQLIGSWIVKNVTLRLGMRSIGIDADDSKFDIKRVDDKKLALVKTVAVNWNAGSTDPIPLADLPPGHIDRTQGMLVGATVELGGQDFQLTLGTKTHGKTLKIQLVSVAEPMTQPGGSGSAGRGV
jgi:hypothetical protein